MSTDHLFATEKVGIYVDGEKIATDKQSLADGRLTAVEAINVQWGRSGPFEQPGPATATLKLITTATDAAASTAARTIRPGSSIAIKAPEGPRRDIISDALAPSQFPRRFDFPWPGENARLDFYTFSEKHTTLREVWRDVGRPVAGTRWSIRVRASAAPGAKMRIAFIYPSTQLVHNGALEDAITYQDIYENGGRAHPAQVLKSWTITFADTGNTDPLSYRDDVVTFDIPTDDAERYTHLGVRLEALAPGSVQFTSHGQWDKFPEGYTWNGDYPRIDYVSLSSNHTYFDRETTIFAGRILTVDTQLRKPFPGLELSVACADATRDLSNRVIGDKPWPRENVHDRIARILKLAFPGKTVRVPIPMTAPLKNGTPWIEKRDVDSQKPLDLIHELLIQNGYIGWIYETDNDVVLYLQRFDRSQWPTDLERHTTIPASVLTSSVKVSHDPSQAVNFIRFRYVDWLTQAVLYMTKQNTALIDKYGPNLYTLTIDKFPWHSEQGEALLNVFMAASAPDVPRLRGVTYSPKAARGFPGQFMDLIKPGLREGRHISIEGITRALVPTGIIEGFLDGGEMTFADNVWNVHLNISPR